MFFVVVVWIDCLQTFLKKDMKRKGRNSLSFWNIALRAPSGNSYMSARGNPSALKSSHIMRGRWLLGWLISIKTKSTIETLRLPLSFKTLPNFRLLRVQIFWWMETHMGNTTKQSSLQISIYLPAELEHRRKWAPHVCIPFCLSV